MGEAEKLKLDVEQEADGRWIAEVPELSGVLACGQTRAEANAKAETLAFRVPAERIENGEATPQIPDLFAGLSPRISL